jgi:hypothetical protein
MKTPLSLTFLFIAAAAQAGQETSYKDMKQTVMPEPLFKEREFQMGTFAVYEVGNGPAHVGLFRNHAWGSGSEINYFFTRNIGVGAEYFGTYALESPDTDRGRLRDHSVNLHHVGGNLFFRWPLEDLHLAPYLYLGGGADLGDRRWAEAHAGVGVEYRIMQHWLPSIFAERVGFFVDGRWTYAIAHFLTITNPAGI